jgi:hypothetical protein
MPNSRVVDSKVVDSKAVDSKAVDSRAVVSKAVDSRVAVPVARRGVRELLLTLKEFSEF